MIQERVRAGLAGARARGKRLSRPRINAGADTGSEMLWPRVIVAFCGSPPIWA
jgi:hypothetical protein